ncbi:MAG TPA: aldehyde dehydrogenase family protein [Phycisphaerales bacterium]|nr:aldehyde dehydrogenase family protein [Phycisphaerales bacterium]
MATIGASAASPSGTMRAPADLIGGRWVPIPGQTIRSENPAHPSETVWSGSPVQGHVDEAVGAARGAFREWSRWPFERRAGVLHRFKQIATARVDAMAALIRDEVGKPLWDAKAEAQLLGAKVDITLDSGPEGSLRRVSPYEVSMGAAMPTRRGQAWFRPHGVMAVLGPFNFPAHLPNGHIVPALALGNTVVFKPSDKAPACGQLLAEFFQEALEAEHAPAGVLNLVQGHAPIAAALASHRDIDGVLFTGSWPVGRRIMEANLDHPGRILALEMGGNNPAVILPDADLKQAVIECVRCAFITAGQRCTCTRRLIVHRQVADRVIPALCKAASQLIIGDPRAEHPVFMGPVISEASRRDILEAQRAMQKAGGEALVLATALDRDGWFMSPGVMRVERFTTGRDLSSEAGADVEIFGPLLRVAVVDSLEDALEQANTTQYGLAASLFTHDQRAIEAFRHECRAGCINVNTGTAGASSKLPFGGLGQSGNHRPAGSFSVDYCAYPVAGMVETADAAQISPGMRFDDGWL